MEKLLSVGALTQILDGMKPAYPVLQIIGYKPMSPDQAAFGTVSEELRYRLMIGDGIKAHQYCIITNQDLVQDIQTGKLEKWSIVKVTSYQTVDSNTPADNKRKLIYILNLEVIEKGSKVGRKLSCQPSDQQDSSTFNQPIQNQPMQQQSFNRQPAFHDTAAPTQPQPYPMQHQHQQHNSVRSPRPMRNSHDNQTIGIAELTPYIGKWVIKGRVTAKSGIREYNNAKGGGKLFNFTLADKTGEIKVTAFNTDCERVFPYVESNKVYVLGRASVKNADKRYNTADFEITLNSDSLLEEVTDSVTASEVPLAKFNFCSIASLANITPNQPVDLIGAITSISDVTTIMSRTKNKELKKRNITIVDMSRTSISVTIWGEQSESFVAETGDIFVTKAARIGTYGGRSASAGDCFFINPDIPEVRKIKNWYSNLLDQNFTCLTNSQDIQGSSDQWKNLAQMLDLEQARIIMSSGQQSALYGKCKAMLMAVGKNPVYKCCPTEGCGKKLTDTQNGELKCEKCQQTYTTFKYRYMTGIEIEDYTSSTWVTLWDEKAENLFQMKPDELERYMKMESKEQYEKIITKPNFQTFLFTLRTRIDTFNNEERVKLQVMSLMPLDPVTYTKRIIEEIRSLNH